MSSAPEREPDNLSDAPLVQPLLVHLEELRWTLIKSLAALAVAMIGCFIFAPDLLRLVIWPLQRVTGDASAYLRTLEVAGGFTLAMRLALYAGLVVACPLILYFIGQFVLPALTRQERALLWPAFSAGAGMFLLGVAVAYFVAIPAGLRFFLHFNERLGIRSEWTIDNYVAFVTHMFLAFGLCFELPLVILVLAKLGIVTHEFLRQKRPQVLVAILVVSAFVTPTTDPFNMALLAGPMYLLYEACVWIAWLLERRRRRATSELTSVP
ncbi:MAG: twin-arginine translocase subunit TatC [Verrucomicrobiae bacterium]|nr:twin-arginine translocase subunit TatC [Verrucomicrobiae bacterium]